MRLAHYFVVSLVRSRAVGLTTAWSRASLTPRTASKRVSPIKHRTWGRYFISAFFKF